jgi:hypothetical protein
VTPFEWNSLRVSDPVVVHEHSVDRYRIPQPGVVAFVVVRRPTNEVGIRIDAPSGAQVLWPTRQEVHAATTAGASACAYCAGAGAPVGSRPLRDPIGNPALLTAGRA